MTFSFCMRISLMQAVSALIFTRFAFLTSLTGGLGALEVSRVLVLQTLWLDPIYGFSISLLIRLRNIFFRMTVLLGFISLIQQRYPQN